MASTYGILHNNRKDVTKCGDKNGITAILKTWDGEAEITLSPDGTLKVNLSGNIKMEGG